MNVEDGKWEEKKYKEFVANLKEWIVVGDLRIRTI